MDDDALIAAMAAGDDTALRALFARHAPWLAARLRSLLPAADVEDVLQETFLAVWRGAAATGRRARRAGGCGGWHAVRPRCSCAAAVRPNSVLPAVVAADGRQAADPAEAALSRVVINDAVGVLGPEGSPDREVWRLCT
jgi:RNA polymerase sigma-70 factor (ECF subfamily)